MSSIGEEILVALAGFPDGEAEVSAIGKAVFKRLSTPRDLALRMREQTDRAKLPRSTPIEASASNIFSNGYVERPRPGVWRITPEGWQLVSDMRWLESQRDTADQPTTDRTEQKLARLAGGEPGEEESGPDTP